MIELTVHQYLLMWIIYAVRNCRKLAYPETLNYTSNYLIYGISSVKFVGILFKSEKVEFRHKIRILVPTYLQLNEYILIYSFESYKKTPWPESLSELYRSRGRRLSAKLVPTFADRGCHVISAMNPYGHILAFLDRPFQSYSFFNILYRYIESLTRKLITSWTNKWHSNLFSIIFAYFIFQL
jgi:hypothetical protein